MDMGLVSGLTNLQQAKTLGQIQVGVAKKILDMQRFQGNAAVKLIEAASKGVAQAGDELVAKATGLGGLLDTYA